MWGVWGVFCLFVFKKKKNALVLDLPFRSRCPATIPQGPLRYLSECPRNTVRGTQHVLAALEEMPNAFSPEGSG